MSCQNFRKKKVGERLSVCFAPWRETVAKRIHEAALAGELKIYLVAREPGCPVKPEYLASPAQAECLPLEVVKLIIPVRGALPDYPVRMPRSPTAVYPIRPAACPSLLRRVSVAPRGKCSGVRVLVSDRTAARALARRG
jgi:hypothetical protein